MTNRIYSQAKYIVEKCLAGADCHVMTYEGGVVRIATSPDRLDQGAHVKSYRSGNHKIEPVYRELLRLTGQPAMASTPMLAKAVAVKQLLDKGKTVWVMLTEEGQLKHTVNPDNVDTVSLIGTYSGSGISLHDLNDDLHHALKEGVTA